MSYVASMYEKQKIMSLWNYSHKRTLAMIFHTFLQGCTSFEEIPNEEGIIANGSIQVLFARGLNYRTNSWRVKSDIRQKD